MQSIYLNNLMYASNLMMGEIAREVGRPADAARFFGRADRLARKVEELLWSEERGCYLAGLATMEDGRVLEAPWSYYNIMIDYPWALGLYPMNPNSQRALKSIDNNVQTSNANGMTGLYFSPSYGHAASIYSWSARYDKALKLLDFMADWCMKEEWSDDLKAIYAMKGSMPETTHTVKFHRPQTFAAAPIMHGIVSLGVSIDFNGINVVPSGHMEKVEGMRFKKGVYDIDLSPVGNMGGVTVDGVAVPHTLRLPSSFYTPGHHKIALLPGADNDPLLLHTTLELLGVKETDGGMAFRVNGDGHGTLRFANCEDKTPRIIDNKGRSVVFEQWSDNTGTYLQVRVRGQVLDVIWKKGLFSRE